MDKRRNSDGDKCHHQPMRTSDETEAEEEEYDESSSSTIEDEEEEEYEGEETAMDIVLENGERNNSAARNHRSRFHTTTTRGYDLDVECSNPCTLFLTNMYYVFKVQEKVGDGLVHETVIKCRKRTHDMSFSSRHIKVNARNKKKVGSVCSDSEKKKPIFICLDTDVVSIYKGNPSKIKPESKSIIDSVNVDSISYKYITSFMFRAYVQTNHSEHFSYRDRKLYLKYINHDCHALLSSVLVGFLTFVKEKAIGLINTDENQEISSSPFSTQQ